MAGTRPFAYKSGDLEIGNPGEAPIAVIMRIALKGKNPPPEVATRVVAGWLHPGADAVRVEFDFDRPLDPGQQQATVALEAWALEAGIAVALPGRESNSFDCPTCGEPVLDFVCSGMSCGRAFCPYCADGSSAGDDGGEVPCPHFVSRLPTIDLEVAFGPLIGEDGNVGEGVYESLPGFPDVGIDRIKDALGEHFPLLEASYATSASEGERPFGEAAASTSLYEQAVERLGGHIILGEMESGGWSGSWSWRDVFVPDPETFVAAITAAHDLARSTALALSHERVNELAASLGLTDATTIAARLDLAELQLALLDTAGAAGSRLDEIDNLDTGVFSELARQCHATAGPTSDVALRAQRLLATALTETGSATEAQDALQSLLAAQIEALGDDHESTRETRRNLQSIEFDIARQRRRGADT